jgi:carbon-monoxide dehydrogenase medium subunit
MFQNWLASKNEPKLPAAGMKPGPFSYHEPASVREAVALLAELAPFDGRILAGGQSLVPAMAFRLARPAHLVDINRIQDLGQLKVDGGALSIGACIRHAAFHRPVIEGELGGLLAFVVRHIAHYPIRTRGTFCGSLANADPASEWCLTAVTLDAEIMACSTRATRSIPAAGFFQGLLTTALETDEFLLEARIPLLPLGTRWGFNEFSRRAGDFAQAMALAIFDLRSGLIAEPRIGIGGVEAVPRRIREAESHITGRAPSRKTFEAAAEAAADAIVPMDDAPETVGYKRNLVRAVTMRALKQCLCSDLNDAEIHPSREGLMA